MKKIDDLLVEVYEGDDYSDTAITNNDEILASVMKKISIRNGDKRMKNKFKTMLIAASITVFMGITAVFATLYIDKNLVEFFRFSQEEQNEIISGIQSPECSASQNGVDVNIIQTLSDSRNVYVIYEVIIPETMIFDNKTNFEAEVCHNEVGTYTHVLEQEGNRRVIMKHLNFNEEINEKQIHFTFKNLQKDGEIIAAGEWDLKWDYDKEKATQIKTVYPNITVNSNDEEAKLFIIEKITFSPFSVLIDCLNKESIMSTDNVLKTDIILYFDDGTALNTNETKTRKERGFTDGMGKANFYFDQYIDINSLKKISIGDTIIELN